MSIHLKQTIEEAKLEYASLVLHDTDKDWLDIFPEPFKKMKRGIIRRVVLSSINRAFKFINSCSLYEGKVFDRKDVVRYMLAMNENKHHLAWCFIPHKSSFSVISDFTNSIKDQNLTKEEEAKKFNEFFENSKLYDVYDELERNLRYPNQCWDAYESRQKIKNGKLIEEWDIEKDGYPSTSRGALCYLYIPVKGEYPKDATGTWILTNPRNGKDEQYKIINSKTEGNTTAYRCLNSKGKEVFMYPHREIECAFIDLFDINKEIFSGWWNRTLISKEVI
jgi:hypothetical protein